MSKQQAIEKLFLESITPSYLTTQKEFPVFKKAVYACAATWGFKDWLYTVVKGGSTWKKLVQHGLIISEDASSSSTLPWGDDPLSGPDDEPAVPLDLALASAPGMDGKHIDGATTPTAPAPVSAPVPVIRRSPRKRRGGSASTE